MKFGQFLLTCSAARADKLVLFAGGRLGDEHRARDEGEVESASTSTRRAISISSNSAAAG